MGKLFSRIACFTALCLLANRATAQADRKYDFLLAPPEIRSLVSSAQQCIDADKDGCTGYLHLAIARSASGENSKALGSLYAKLLSTYFLYGQYDSILHYKWPALSIALQRREYYNLAAIYNLIGAAYVEYGDNTDSALHYFLTARPYFTKLKDSTKLAENYSNTAGVYVDIEDDLTALKNYKTGYGIALGKQDYLFAGIIASNIGECYLRMDSLDAAKYWSLTGVRFSERANVPDDLINGYAFLSSVYKKEKAFDSALHYSNLAMQLSEQVPNLGSRALAFTNHARILMEQKRYKDALTFVLKSIPINESQNNTKALSRDYYTAAVITASLSDFKTAVQYHEKNYAILYEVVSGANLQAIRNAQEKYETEKKERLIAEKELIIEKNKAQTRLWLSSCALLVAGLGLFSIQYRRTQKAKASQAEQEKENAVLKAWMSGEERERNRISQELHDGVASMLGAARMNLQALPHLPAEKHDVQWQKVSTILENTHSDVRRIAHNLLPVTLQKEGLIKAVDQFVSDINDTGILQINLRNDFIYVALVSQQTQLMLFRIIQELINNILKHSAATTATIWFSGTPEYIRIEVKDNGKGFSLVNEEESQGLFSIRQRLQALGGAFDINSKDGEGTVASLEVRLGDR